MTTNVSSPPSERLLAFALEALSEGSLIVYPTDTLYALGADALSERAVQAVFDAKGRPGRFPISVAVATIPEISQLVRLTDSARRLAARFLPGPLTLVCEARPGVPKNLLSGTPNLGVRIPNHPTALSLLRRFGPLTATSANLHGRPDPSTATEARAQLGDSVRVVLDGGPAGGAPSTVVDATGSEVTLLREGAIPASELFHAIRS